LQIERVIYMKSIYVNKKYENQQEFIPYII